MPFFNQGRWRSQAVIEFPELSFCWWSHSTSRVNLNLYISHLPRRRQAKSSRLIDPFSNSVGLRHADDITDSECWSSAAQRLWKHSDFIVTARIETRMTTTSISIASCHRSRRKSERLLPKATSPEQPRTEHRSMVICVVPGNPPTATY